MERVNAIECRIPDSVVEVTIRSPVTYRLVKVNAKDSAPVVQDKFALAEQVPAKNCEVGAAVNAR